MVLVEGRNVLHHVKVEGKLSRRNSLGEMYGGNMCERVPFKMKCIDLVVRAPRTASHSYVRTDPKASLVLVRILFP